MKEIGQEDWKREKIIDESSEMLKAEGSKKASRKNCRLSQRSLLGRANCNIQDIDYIKIAHNVVSKAEHYTKM